MIGMLVQNLGTIHTQCKSSPPEVLLGKVVRKICSKFTGEHPCQSVNSIKLPRKFIKITLQRGCSPVNLLHLFRTPFPKNTSGWLLLSMRFVPSTFLITFLCVFKILSHLSHIKIKLQGSTIEILQALNEIESSKEMYKLLRCEIDQQFHIIYEHAGLMSEK